jgi:hypothetical protein
LYYLSNLVGKWKIKRNINSKIFLKGFLHIVKNKNNSLIYSEKFFSNKTGEENAYQNYLIKPYLKKAIFYFLEGPDKLKKFQIFHKNQINYSKYFCKKDRYEMKIHIMDNNYFKIIYKIKGPKKSYVINSDYKRTIL